MNNSVNAKILHALLHTKGVAQITVSGNSMEPTLHDGDIVTIISAPSYNIGDILVYSYKSEGLLIHRLLKQESHYYCKGDNAFRLETVSSNDIIGKIILINSHEIIPWVDWKIKLSYSVSRQFLRCMCNKQQTMQSEIYRLYRALIFEKEYNTMIYEKNRNMDYIIADATSLAVYDPEKDSTYFFDEIGIDILNILEEPCTLNTLLERLAMIYDATPEEMRSDVEEFLVETIQKKVVKIQ